MDEEKRVYTLYRVSTLGQVDKDDIPMQRQRCQEFAEMQGWTIVKEFYEKGVSGYKVSAKDRDAIQSIQQDALENKFDILLVFMFDRLGRRDDETPFVVEWFVRNGIEVWSTMEGQQRFDSHVDKLMNYIRYWQASGESLKTSLRVKTRLNQMTESGLYTGGSVTYGYKLVKSGRTNKKNHEVYDIAVDEEEAEVVRIMFHKYVHEGMGARRISQYLQEIGRTNREGKWFPTTTITHMLKNERYTGIIKNGGARSDLIPELQIIPNDVFDEAQKIMLGRVHGHGDIPLNMSGQALLTGKVYCGHCGGRLTMTTSGRKRVLEDGVVKYEPKLRYCCHYKVRNPGQCNGQSGYTVKILDKLVDDVVRMKLMQIKNTPIKDMLEKQRAIEVELAKSVLARTVSEYKAKQREIEDLTKETIKVIRGESCLSPELLNKLISDANEELKKLAAKKQEAQEDLNERMTTCASLKKEQDDLLNWADIYDDCSFNEKKMILAHLIKAVYVQTGYKLRIEFNISFEEYKSYCTEEKKPTRGSTKRKNPA